MKLIKIVSSISILTVISMIASFLSSILIVRLLGAELYGKYIYLTALIAILPIWYTAFDQILIRFAPEESTEKKIELLKGVIFLKILFFLLLSSIFSIYIFTFERNFIQQDNIFLLVMILLLCKEFITIFQTSYSAIINIYEKYISLTFASVANSIIYLLFIFIISFQNFSHKKILFLMTFFMLTGTFLTYLFSRHLANKLLKINYSLYNISLSNIKNIFVRNKIMYFGPLQFTNIQSYLKLYLAQLLLANFTTYTNVAYYELIRKIFTITHKFIPKIMDLFIPSLIYKKNQDHLKFLFHLKQYSMFYFLSVSLLALLLFYNSNILFNVYNLEYTKDAQLMTFIFSMNLIVLSISNFHGLVQKTSSNTIWIAIASFIHSTFGSLIMYLLVQKYNMVGAALGTLIGSFILAFFNICGTWKYFKIPFILIIYVMTSISLLFISYIYTKGVYQ